MGSGGWSNEAAATTPATVPEVVNLAATSASATAIDLTWTAPGDGSSTILSYRLYRKTGAADYTLVSRTIVADATSYRDSGRSKGTAYTYRIRAVNAMGQGFWSSEASATTGIDAPEAVDDLAATAASATAIDLKWTAPGNGGSSITSYRLERKTGTADYTLVSLSIKADATSYADSSLAPGTAYAYRIRAVNAVGSGAWSNEPAAATPAIAPEAVDDLAATAASATAIDLKWTAPGNGGSSITSYDLERKKASGSYTLVSSTIAADAESYADSSLAPATAYIYRIRAVNGVGSGDWSNGVRATTPADVPEVVSTLAATATSATAINLTWTAPGDGGSAITGYRLERKAGVGGYTLVSLSIAADATSHTDSGLNAGTTYTYRIRAVNAVGNGGWSSEASATTGSTMPGAPTSLGAAANGQTQIDLSWTAPSSDGGAAISGYKIEVSDDGGTTWTNLVNDTSSTTTSYSHTGLTAGTTRHYRVSAINTAGTGAASNVASAATANAANAAPEAVDDLAATSASTSAINLTWTAPGDGGSAITRYRLERKTASGSYSVVSSSIATDATSYADSSLSAGTAYTYRLRAVNAVGNGGWSNQPSATTAAETALPPPPSPPVTVIGGGGGFGGFGGPTPGNWEPEFIDRPRASRSVPEGTSPGASLGDPVAATDLDNDALTYTLRGVDADSFGIDSHTGQLLVKAALDYETRATYSLQAHVVDGAGGSDTIALTVIVTDVDEPPAIAGPVAIAYKENSLHVVAVPTARDPEGSQVSWSLTGDDAGAFTISATGALTFNAPPDYEAPADADADNVYQVTLQATDLKGMMGILPMAVSVTDAENDGIWNRYDFNKNGLIERNEALAAVFDYFADLIAKQQALEVVFLYFAS